MVNLSTKLNFLFPLVTKTEKATQNVEVRWIGAVRGHSRCIWL